MPANAGYLRVPFTGLFGRGLYADKLQPQGVYAIENPVQVGLVYDLPRNDRQPSSDPHIHPIERSGEALADLRTHYDPVRLTSPLSAAYLHAMTSDDRYCQV